VKVRPLRDRLIAARICVDCQLELVAQLVRCARCNETHKRKARELYRAKQRPQYQPSHPNGKRAVMAAARLRSYTTAKERGLIK
jgi:hypothetical protein